MTDPTTTIAGDAPNLAIDVLPDDVAGSFLLDESEVDGLELLGWGDEGWSNVVCDVRRVRVARGASRSLGALTRAEAGTAGVELVDVDRRFDPIVNADAIHPGTPLRLRAWGVDPQPWEAVLFTGRVSGDIAVDYQRGDAPVVTLVAVDVIGPLARFATEGRTVPAGHSDDLLTRVIRVLLEAGLAGAVATAERTRTMVTYPALLPVATTVATQVRDRLAGTAEVRPDWTWDGAPLEVLQHAPGVRAEYRPPGDVIAAWQLADRFRSGLPVFEDFTWHGYPQEVQDWHQYLADLCPLYPPWPPSAADREALAAWMDGHAREHQRTWLADYVARTTPPASPTTTTITRTAYVSADRVSPDSDAAYAASLTASTLARGWDDITSAVEAELGRVWVDSADRLVVRGRGSELSGPVRGTLSDWHGESVTGEGDDPHCCYLDPVVRFGTEQLVNRTVGVRRTVEGDDSQPATVVRDDLYSQARWSDRVPVTHESRSLELVDDGEVTRWAESLLLAGSTPELRVDSVMPRPPDAAAWQAVCATDIGDRWHFRLHPPVGDTVLRTVGVLGVVHDITPDGWEATFTTVDAPTPGVDNPSGWVVLDLSDLDSGDVLAPFGGAVA